VLSSLFKSKYSSQRHVHITHIIHSSFAVRNQLSHTYKSRWTPSCKCFNAMVPKTHTQCHRVLGSILKQRCICIGQLWPFLYTRLGVWTFFLFLYDFVWKHYILNVIHVLCSCFTYVSFFYHKLLHNKFIFTLLHVSADNFSHHQGVNVHRHLQRTSCIWMVIVVVTDFTL
jgi:hypothetical protein